jgi:hypothetical protein
MLCVCIFYVIIVQIYTHLKIVDYQIFNVGKFRSGLCKIKILKFHLNSTNANFKLQCHEWVHSILKRIVITEIVVRRWIVNGHACEALPQHSFIRFK